MKYMTHVLLLAAILLSGCSEQETTSGKDADKAAAPPATAKEAPVPQVKGTMLLYGEEEAGVEPYQVTVYITDDFIRFEDDPRVNSFVLYDRRKRVIYSVSVENATILSIRHVPEKDVPPFDGALVEKKMDTESPPVAGYPSIHYQYLLDDQVCMNVFAIDNLMEDVAQAYREYRETLATEQAAALKMLPMDTQDPCDAVLNVYEPVRILTQGLPIMEWNDRGFRRSLMDYKEGVLIDAAKFELPEGYGVMDTRQMREGVATPAR